MTEVWNSFTRKAYPLMAGAMLLQVGGCSTETSNLAAGWISSIATELISGFVFRNFNLTV